MSRSPENVRVRRTRILLREALIDLIEEHGFERVTVGQITERAMVSRAAFYRNYRDKYQLVEQIFDEAAAALTDASDSDSDTDRLRRLELFFEHVAQFTHLYRALLGPKGSRWFATRIQDTVTGMTATHLPLPTPVDNLVATLLGSMFVQTVTWWLTNNQPLPARDMAANYASLAAAIIQQAGTPDFHPGTSTRP
ncbi:TetR/AcrR family transcriptional regulator [Nocardia aurantiaca]|uniref:TetR family transcriptional regulator n=1 Tax=Nocardia aurantiaca TaxID=2675850 RepID=A0A6I3KY98_9NOCA|nr:TetR/AcrR family transcriptional regulator [Nocardia aurantiaca]MTE13365.1 TetR family transcriptional regulator [Nocardia aurantiaca]